MEVTGSALSRMVRLKGSRTTYQLTVQRLAFEFPICSRGSIFTPCHLLQAQSHGSLQREEGAL